LTLERHEEEILRRMYDEEVIAMNYKPVEAVRSKINWIQIAQEHRIKKKFSSIMERLEKKGYVDSHGKSGYVYSLSFQGVAYVTEKFGRG
jgi:hypothetical protein